MPRGHRVLEVAGLWDSEFRVSGARIGGCKASIQLHLPAASRLLSIQSLPCKVCSPPLLDRIWGMWGFYYNIPKAMFYLLKGD